MKILSTLIFSFVTTVLYAQTVNYQVEIVEFRISGCDDGFGSDEEPTWKAWGRDDINTAFVGGSCFQQDANEPFTHSAGNTLLIAQSATNATAIDIKLEAWEDDNISSADRCSYDSGDDCHVDNTFPSINYQNDPHCTWNEYVLTSGNFSVVVRINWQYTMFDGGTNIIDCSTTVPLSSQGSGSWSIYTGTSGSFLDINDPSTNFSGSLGSYVLLWSSLPNCLNVYTPDTVTVDFISTPAPNMTVSSNTICEGTDITFNAQNGTLYDWSLNTNGNVVLSDGSGAICSYPFAMRMTWFMSLQPTELVLELIVLLLLLTHLLLLLFRITREFYRLKHSLFICGILMALQYLERQILTTLQLKAVLIM